ncbi:uncharacterized protein MELLADRAFT_85823 [Melampsora larici-populina 98AG31]|uniref:DUF4470 domain-containing protein n=1 Tax=Melampsora larici-populina (strain 98AG31 / pathotype 3-4-7) TaxID=747676 RepID=F4RJW8_MELLP|nr:uncharacterized protein MELLADRAFT_85823 [Melampsora larici-populina 98AG31]EGG07424.1 hypothetical protein MELLADRAFT_85823 [Melampsora larici-populina 98AG31]
MSSNTERAEDARQRGNAFYKACQLSKAIVAYKLAATLVPSDPTPLSNLSAAAFETGDYAKSVQYSTEALALLEQDPDDDPRKHKLLTRLTKARRYHTDPDDSSAKESLRDAIFRLPRYRPYLAHERNYYPVGHDIPEPLYCPTLRRTTKGAQVVSFMFCGIGDARNMVHTILNYDFYGPKSHESDQRLHLTILDVKPAILARDLILFALLDDISLTMGLSRQEAFQLDQRQPNQLLETLNTASYFYMAQVMPAFAWERIQAIIQRLLDSFDNSKQPIPWVYIPATVQAAVRPRLEAWKQEHTGPYSTEAFREITALDKLQAQMARIHMPEDLHVDPYSSFPRLMFDKRVYDEFYIVLPDEKLLNAHDAELAKIVRDYRNEESSADGRISSYIDRKWKPNLTLADILWEKENTMPQYQPRPNMDFSPCGVIESLLEGVAGDRGLSSVPGNTLMSVLESYFMMIGKAIANLRNRITVEVCFGEMSDHLEKIRYQAHDRSTETEAKDRFSSAKWPHKYHLIHMSNIPDYTGGPFTSFLYGVPILEYGPGTGVTSYILRNPSQFEGVSRYFSEYLVMYDRKLVRSHFQLELSIVTPANEEGPSPLMRYLRWERIPQKLLTFEQLMPQAKLLHWLYTHFLKICLPYPRKSTTDPGLIYAPLNMTAFLRLLEHVSELGYPAHWISNLIDSILSGKIITTARPPPRQVLTPQDVDTVYPARAFCTTPWILEFATLAGLWRTILRAGLVVSSAVPRSGDVVQYIVKIPCPKLWDGQVPHSMLVFCDENAFGSLPKNIRSILNDDGSDLDVKSRALRHNVRCVSTFYWSVKAQEATFWITKDAFEEMKGWNVYIWSTASWEKGGGGVKLGNAVVKNRSWGEWEDPPNLMLIH